MDGPRQDHEPRAVPDRTPIGIPVGRRDPGRRPAKRPTAAPGRSDALVLVGHGSQCKLSAREVGALAGLVGAALPDVTVDVGYLEMTDPPAGAVIDDLVAAGARRIVVLPLVLLAAGHAKSDVPAVVVDARDRHPDIELAFGHPLGVTRPPIEVLGRAVTERGGTGLPLLVVARGTSDPDANGEAYKAARLLAEWTDAPFVHVGFSGVTRPSIPEAAGVFATLGYARVAVAWWYLCHGRLIEIGRELLAGVAGATGLDLVDCGHIGADPALVPLVVTRYREARAGAVAANCDTCAYRAPWPGREERVGQPVGIGHSHLAAEHRHRH